MGHVHALNILVLLAFRLARRHTDMPAWRRMIDSAVAMCSSRSSIASAASNEPSASVMVHEVIKFLRGGFKRATMLMAEHADQTDMQLLDRILQRSDDGTIDELTGGAHGEQVTQALIEDDFGGTRESEQASTAASGFWPSSNVWRVSLSAMDGRLAFGESAIALEHTAPRRICGRFLFNVCLSHENLHYQRTAGTHSSD